MQLKTANILLTGGKGGLGSALVDKLRVRGAKVLTAGLDSGESIHIDFSDPKSVEHLCEKISGRPIDILINNAGLQYFGRTHEQSDVSIEKMIAVNMEVPLRLTKALLPGMLARGRGQIVNIGSVFGAIPFPHFSVYCATKAGMKAFSQSIRREYGGKNIAVTYIAPRALRTAMNAGPVFELMKRTRSAMDYPEIVAVKIVRAIEMDRKEISIGLSESVFARVNALAPGIMDGALIRSRDIGDQLLPVMKI